MVLEVVTCEGLNANTRVFLGDNRRVEVPTGFTATFVARDPASTRVYVIQEPTRSGKTSKHEGSPPESAPPRQFGFKSYELFVGEESAPLERVDIRRLEESRDSFYVRITYEISGHIRELDIPVLMVEPPRDCHLGKSLVLERLI